MTTFKFQDIEVPSPGFGAMSLSGAHGPADDEESLKLLKAAYDMGCTFWDSAVVYGFGHNESLLGRFLKQNPGTREKLFIASKCAWEIDPVKKTRGGITNKREHIIKYLQDSTERLGTAPDLYYLHRRDPNTTLEESIGTLNELKKAGKCRYIGISECSAKTLREACQIAHIDAIQIEYSAFCLDNEQNGLISTAKELGVSIVAFSPLGAGFLTGKYDKETFQVGSRAQAGRFQGQALENNLKLVEKFKAIADKKGCTAGQLAIAWCTAMGTIPIPGTKNAGKLEENWGAAKVKISDQELDEIREIMKGGAEGSRWGEAIMAQMGK